MRYVRALVILFVILFLILNLWGAASADKLVVVTSASWGATQGELRQFERSSSGRWVAVGRPLAVVVGKGGMGWGEGLASPRRDLGGPDKKEGDGRTPAGIFALAEATGYDDAPPPGTTLPYRTASTQLRCVDDGASKAYNTLADAPGDWSSAEVMRRADELYRLTIVVAHNAARAPGKGSCIFLHVWRSAAAPTVGCTAMPLESLARLLGWVDKETRLVELPRPVYDKVAADWALPTL